MLVDNQLNFNFASQPAFEDFFNMDLLAGPSSGASSSSRSSSSSPSNSFSPLPPTPPNAFGFDDPITSRIFSFLDDEFLATSKADPQAPPPTTAAAFDFLGAFPTSPVVLQSSSPESGPASVPTPASSTTSAVGIDPQLVGTPATAKDMSDFGDEEELQSPTEQDLPDSFDSPLSPADDSFLEPHKVGGRGKTARKGTVQSGGIVKKSGAGVASAALALTPPPEKRRELPAGILSTTSMEPDDWRPTPEEYKKMSSKEKRQLRNKISARNFRVRRKEYISTLEGDIAERDRLIDHIRTELLGTKSENTALRQEIQSLKKALLDGRGLPTTPVLPPPGPLDTISAAATASASPAKPPTPKSPLLTPNIHKDLPTSPRLGARNFWGGAAATSLGGFGGITPVHTALLPEWGSVLSGKPMAANAERRNTILQENINPHLNVPSSYNALASPKLQQPGSQFPMNPFDSFADKNLFTLKTMEDYRMHLWTRMGQQQALFRQMQQQQQPSSPSPPPSPFTGHVTNLRPHHFKSPTSSLSGKAASTSYSSSSSSSPQAGPSNGNYADQQAILAASLASQTLFKKLGGAFWDAFSGSSPSSNPGVKPWDADKVRKVLEGKAVVRVVDVDPQPEKVLKRPTSPTISVTERMASMSLGASSLPVESLSSSSTSSSSTPSTPTLSPSSTSLVDKKSCKGCGISGILEERLRNMRL